MVLLLLAGKCYEAEICAIRSFLRCPFRWYPILLDSKFSVFGLKPWTIVRHFDQISFRTHNSSLEGATELKFCRSAPLEVPFLIQWDPANPDTYGTHSNCPD